MRRHVSAVALLTAAMFSAPAPARGAEPACADSTECKGDRLYHAGQCVPARSVVGLCPAGLRCADNHRWTYFFLDLFCADKLEGKRLELLRKTVERGRIGGDGLAWIFNAH